jgi:enoyl-CoA hydratase
MELKSIRFEIVDSEAKHRIAVIRINRPEALNALNKQVLNDLKILVQELGSKRDVRAAVLTGEGEKSFVAGADIKEMESLTPAQARELALQGQTLFGKIEELPFPVICAMNGFALGGGLELALACDFIIASNKAKWGLPEVTLGLIPGYGGTQRLTRQVGPALAKRIAMSGEMFTATQGFEWGLFAQVCDPNDVVTTAMKIASTMAARAPMAVAWVKEAIRTGGDKTLSEGLKIEADLFARTFETKDHSEGIMAFIEKRPANFQGN